MTRAASAPGQGRVHWSDGPHQADPSLNSQECSRYLTPCSDTPDEEAGAGEEAEESTGHSGASTSATLHLYLPSPFYDEEGEKENDQEDARHPAVLSQQQETMDSKTVPPEKKGPRHGMAKQKRSVAARVMPALRQEGKLSAASGNAATPEGAPPATVNCVDPASSISTPAPPPSPQHPQHEEERQANIKGPPCCSAARRLVWRPSKAKDNYYERAILSKASDHFKLKTTTTLEWGLHGPQARKTVFILQGHSSRPASSLSRANASIPPHGSYSRPSSTPSCVRTDLSHLQAPEDCDTRCDTL